MKGSAAIPASLAGMACLAALVWFVRPPDLVRRGAAVYAANCAACHGAHLEGQPRWWEPGADGMLPAPPHDQTGHTWQHSDAQIFDLIAHSVVNVAPAGYRSAMPAFAGRLTDGDIRAVIAFIKSKWPPGVRAYQASRNPGGPTLADLPGNWTFPPSCDLHFGPPPS